MGKSPTALNRRGKKIEKYGEKWDSQKELWFYERFIMDKWPSRLVSIHPKFELLKLKKIGIASISSISYTPDVVIYTRDGHLKHVYDVKNSFGPYGIDNGNRLTFRLFAMKYGIPIEAVVVRSHDFRCMAIGVTKPLRSSKAGKAPDPIIRDNPAYSWIESTNY